MPMSMPSQSKPPRAESTSTADETEEREHRIDDILNDSFPASDPPSWTFGSRARKPRPAAPAKPAR